METLELMNGALAGAGAFAVLIAVNHMGPQTSRAIRCAFVTTGAGLLGECLSSVPALLAYFGLRSRILFEWQLAYDSLLYGGVLALLIGSRRMPVLLPERWVGRLSLAVTLVTWAIFLFGIQA